MDQPGPKNRNQLQTSPCACHNFAHTCELAFWFGPIPTHFYLFRCSDFHPSIEIDTYYYVLKFYFCNLFNYFSFFQYGTL